MTSEKILVSRKTTASFSTRTELGMVDPKGKSDFARMFHIFHYGDYVSYYLSTLRNVDPKDIALIEELKKNLK